MAYEIRLDNIGFLLKVTAMEIAGENLQDKVEVPEITADMKTLEKYLENYDKLSQVLQ